MSEEEYCSECGTGVGELDRLQSLNAVLLKALKSDKQAFKNLSNIFKYGQPSESSIQRLFLLNEEHIKQIDSILAQAEGE